MSKTILIAGYGPGTSTAVAQKFGAEGFSVALVGRTPEKLAAGVKELEAKGIKAAAFPTDLADPHATRALIGKVRAALGPVTVLQWSAYANTAGDLLTADVATIRGTLDIAVTSLLTAVQAALPDLRKETDAAILVINGGLAYYDASVDAAAAQWGVMGLAVANAAKHKIVGLLSQKLKNDGIYVGEVVITGSIKGTAFDSGQATIEASAVADKLWALYRARDEISGQVS